jgi:hypothetical protein
MEWLGHLRLFALFELYLAAMFLLGIWLRVRQYRDVLHLVASVPTRWPRVGKLVRAHAHILLTWRTVLPLLLSAGLLLIQLITRWYVFPDANLTAAMLGGHRLLLPVDLLALVAMVGYDIYYARQVGVIDRPDIEKQLDQAEYWLRSWTAPVVRVLSLGYINPRGMVAKEVADALVATSDLMNSTLYAVALQAGLRLLFGVSLWTTYFLP